MMMRPVANTIAKLVIALGAMMALPALADWWEGDRHWQVFAVLGCAVALLGGLVVIATRGAADQGMSIRQGFLLTAGTWLVLPGFGALPFMLGEPGLDLTDAVFESMSGMTTTGTTVIPALDGLPAGVNLWRAMLQWMGGLGIVVVAVAFLPAMRVGGMQFFRSEGFDTGGKDLPRAGDIAGEMTRLYILMTVACMLVFNMLGMAPFDAVVFALATCSTGGYANYDASFGPYAGPAQYAAALFMLLATLPFVRMAQALRGELRPILRDPQVLGYLRWVLYAVLVILAYRLFYLGEGDLPAMLRETVFNTVSIFSGTGFTSSDVTTWGHLPFAVLIVVGLVGGCTGSTGCSVKVFRYQVLAQAVRAQIRRMHSPHRVHPVRMDGRALTRDVIDSVMGFFTMFILTLGVLIVGLALTGLHPLTALTGAWTAIANIGPVWGPEITATGAVTRLPEAAKWLMVVGMYLGRLELIAVFVLLMPRFWRG